MSKNKSKPSSSDSPLKRSWDAPPAKIINSDSATLQAILSKITEVASSVKNIEGEIGKRIYRLFQNLWNPTKKNI